MGRNNSCLDCKHYTEDIGDKGYCKLYRHNTASPEIACPKFERKETKERRNTFNVERVKELVFDEASMNRYKNSATKMFMPLSVMCVTVLSILLLIFSSILCATLATYAEVRTLHKAIFIIVVGSFVISLIVVVCMLLSKFRVMRFIVPALSFFIILFLLIFSNEVWFDFHSLIMTISETIFNTTV